MNLVQPIRSRHMVNEFGKTLKEHNEKYFVMFRVGVTSGLRISDMLNIKVSDITQREYITVKEKKTSKKKTFKLNKKTKELCLEFITDHNLKDDDYLIYSNKKSKDGGCRPITRQHAYLILKRTSGELGLEDVGCHTLRKTFGYWHYKQFKDVAMLQGIFNHSSPSITLRYIGIAQDEADLTMQELDI